MYAGAERCGERGSPLGGSRLPPETVPAPLRTVPALGRAPVGVTTVFSINGRWPRPGEQAEGRWSVFILNRSSAQAADAAQTFCSSMKAERQRRAASHLPPPPGG